MAPRLVSDHPGGEPVALGKQKVVSAAVGEGNNRRALGDIGNVVSRPITRSFNAQLLANAQGPAVTKKQVAGHPPLPPAAAKGAAKQQVKKKEVVKPKVAKVIEISPDLKQKACKKEAVAIKKEKEPEIIIIREASSSHKKGLEIKNIKEGVSSRKKGPTLSAILAKRSTFACGLTGKQIKNIYDIDRADAGNEMAVVDYIEDIYKFYKLAEVSSMVPDYMNLQTEINAKMRGILTDWLVEVHTRFELQPETLYLTVHIIDRYLSNKIVHRRDLQLVGVTAMLIAAKYEEIWAPEVNDFVAISDKAYSREQVLKMEKLILNHLEWSLTWPTPYMFLVRFLKAAGADKEMECLAYFLSELSLLDYYMITYSPSMLAASAVYAARCTLGVKPSWTETLKKHTCYREDELQACTKWMVLLHSNSAESRLKVVHKKYSSSQNKSVAARKPAAVFLGAEGVDYHP